MLKILPIKQVVLTEGSLIGTPCTVVKLNEKGEDTEMNDIVTEVLKSKLRLVVIDGKLIENIEIKAIIEGLTSKGKLVYFVTDASDSIESIRRLRGVIFCLKLVPPTSTKNNIDTRNLPLLQDADEIMITFDSFEEYEVAKKYVGDRLISRPTVFFRGGDKMEVSDRVDVVSSYLKDAENFNFKNRLINLSLSNEETK